LVAQKPFWFFRHPFLIVPPLQLAKKKGCNPLPRQGIVTGPPKQELRLNKIAWTRLLEEDLYTCSGFSLPSRIYHKTTVIRNRRIVSTPLRRHHRTDRIAGSFSTYPYVRVYTTCWLKSLGRSLLYVVSRPCVFAFVTADEQSTTQINKHVPRRIENGRSQRRRSHGAPMRVVGGRVIGR